MQADVIMVIGANPTDGHPVFASQMKRRLREGAKLIVVDPRAIDLVRSPHIKADYHLKLRPGTNVAVADALAHVIVTEGLVDEAFVAARCETKEFSTGRTSFRSSATLLKHWRHRPAYQRRKCVRRHGSTPTAETALFITAWA